MRIRSFVAALTAAAGLFTVPALSLTAASNAGAATKAPTCATVSTSAVKAALGGTVQTTPSSNSQTDSFYGFKQTTLGCTYSTTASISYSTPATTTAYNAELKTLKNVAGAKTVSGLGQGAFTGTGTNTASSCSGTPLKCVNKTVTTYNLYVLVTGVTLFEISGSGSVTFAKEETLAKQMLKAI